MAGSAEAITVARNEEFNIVVLDCKMPDPGTAQLAAELHAQIENLHIIFIHLDEGCDKGVSIDPELDVELPRPFYLPVRYLKSNFICQRRISPKGIPR